jgi:murein DD-endopeptidase MepM/ murein hydrolase activator NlpD
MPESDKANHSPAFRQRPACRRRERAGKPAAQIRRILSSGALLLVLVCLPGLSGCLHGGPRIARSATPSRPSIWPVSSPGQRISSRFGEQRGSRTHKGLDIRVEKGTPIVATADGIAVFSGRQRGYGRVVILEHPGDIQTVYAHLKKQKAKAGRRVRQGQVIGKAGASGNATAPHLHYEIRQSGRPVNPASWLP